MHQKNVETSWKEAREQYFIWKTKFGFRKRCGTREETSVMRLLFERRLDFYERLIVCFLDLEKALIELSGQSFSKFSKRSE